MTNLPKPESRINYDLFTAWDTQDLKEHLEFVLTHQKGHKENQLALPLIKQHLTERGYADYVEVVEWEINCMQEEGVL